MSYNTKIANSLIDFFADASLPHIGRYGYGFVPGSFPEQDIRDTAKKLIDSGKIAAEIIEVHGEIIVREILA